MSLNSLKIKSSTDYVVLPLSFSKQTSEDFSLKQKVKKEKLRKKLSFRREWLLCGSIFRCNGRICYVVLLMDNIGSKMSIPFVNSKPNWW